MIRCFAALSMGLSRHLRILILAITVCRAGWLRCNGGVKELIIIVFSSQESVIMFKLSNLYEPEREILFNIEHQTSNAE